MASGSMRSSRIAGLPAASARSNAGAKSRGALDGLAVPAEGARIGGEIRIRQFGARDAARIFALLVHADRAVHAVVDDQHDDRRAVLHRGRELLPVHEELAVARERDHRALRLRDLRRDRRRHAVAHRAAGRRELRAPAAV